MCWCYMTSEHHKEYLNRPWNNPAAETFLQRVIHSFDMSDLLSSHTLMCAQPLMSRPLQIQHVNWLRSTRFFSMCYLHEISKWTHNCEVTSVRPSVRLMYEFNSRNTVSFLVWPKMKFLGRVSAPDRPTISPTYLDAQPSITPLYVTFKCNYIEFFRKSWPWKHFAHYVMYRYKSDLNRLIEKGCGVVQSKRESREIYCGSLWWYQFIAISIEASLAIPFMETEIVFNFWGTCLFYLHFVIKKNPPALGWSAGKHLSRRVCVKASNPRAYIGI